MHACEQGWICNSSICMTRRGMKPTGIAIFEAQQQGFPSVAHFVQVPRPPAIMLTMHSCVLYSSKAGSPAQHVAVLFNMGWSRWLMLHISSVLCGGSWK